MAEETIVTRRAPICVVQFNKDPRKDQKLEELKETNTWDRRPAPVGTGEAKVIEQAGGPAAVRGRLN